MILQFCHEGTMVTSMCSTKLNKVNLYLSTCHKNKSSKLWRTVNLNIHAWHSYLPLFSCYPHMYLMSHLSFNSIITTHLCITGRNKFPHLWLTILQHISQWTRIKAIQHSKTLACGDISGKINFQVHASQYKFLNIYQKFPSKQYFSKGKQSPLMSSSPKL